MIELNLTNIQDSAVRQAFESIVEQLNSVEILRGQWDYLEYTFNFSTATQVRLNHRLKFRPTDIIELHVDSGITALTFDKQYFTPTTVYFTANGAGTFRVLVGKHNKGG